MKWWREGVRVGGEGEGGRRGWGGGVKNRGKGSKEEALTLSPSSSLTHPPRQHCLPQEERRDDGVSDEDRIYIWKKKGKIPRWRRREDDARGSQGKQAPSVIRLVTAAIPAAAALPGACRRCFLHRGRSYISEQRSPPTTGLHPDFCARA